MNIADMFGKLSDMQSKMEEVQKELDTITVEADAGGGMVKVKATARKKILSIKIDKDVVDPNDVEMLEDLIVAGVNKAFEKADDASQYHMQKKAKDMMPGGFPGFDPSSLGM